MCDVTVCGKGVLPERRGVEVKERVQHGRGMGEATSGSEGLRKYEGALGSRSGSESGCDMCLQKINAILFQGPVNGHVKFAILGDHRMLQT
jgi:hypothetical protein